MLTHATVALISAALGLSDENGSPRETTTAADVHQSSSSSPPLPLGPLFTSLHLTLASVDVTYVDQWQGGVHVTFEHLDASVSIYTCGGVGLELAVGGLEVADTSAEEQNVGIPPVMGPGRRAMPAIARRVVVEAFELAVHPPPLPEVAGCVEVHAEDLQVYGYTGETGNFIAR